VRLFLAIDLGEALRSAIGSVQQRLRERLDGWRWVAAPGIHLTVRFLGEIAPETLGQHLTAWRGTAASCAGMRLRVRGLGVFPPRGVPRVLWIGVEEVEPQGSVEALGRVFERTARHLGLPPETRPFRPHLTLARAGRHGWPAAPSGEVVGDLGVIDAREVVLFRSELSPRGARYTPIETFPFCKKGA
jgi:2'-5' RNA ligase